MKKLLVVVAVLFSAIHAGAQTKGQSVFNGTMGLSLLSYDGESYTSFAIGAGAGYFITDRFQLGALVGYTYESDVDLVEFDLSGVYYVPVTDNFYYTPSLTFAVGYFLEDVFAYGAEIGLGTFEFKISKTLGISLGLLNFSFVSVELEGIFSLSLCSPTFGISVYL